jgi:hypothetical protein
MIKEILTKASDLIKRASLVDWMMMVQGEVIIDRDMSTSAGVVLDMAADVTKLVAGVLLFSPNSPTVALFHPTPRTPTMRFVQLQSFCG